MFRATSISLMLFAAGVLLSSCVTRDEDGVRQVSHHMTTVSGERLKLDYAIAVKQDCSMRIIPDMYLFQPPEHGKVDFVHEKQGGKFRGDYKQCNGKEVPGTIAYYTSEKGFSGHDRTVIRISYRDGHVIDKTIDINVVK